MYHILLVLLAGELLRVIPDNRTKVSEVLQIRGSVHTELAQFQQLSFDTSPVIAPSRCNDCTTSSTYCIGNIVLLLGKTRILYRRSSQQKYAICIHVSV
jgi:hypothetical protein